MTTELAPDVRARVRAREPVPTRPAGGAGRPGRPRRPVQRFGSTRVQARHHWVVGTLLVLAALVVLAVVALG